MLQTSSAFFVGGGLRPARSEELGRELFEKVHEQAAEVRVNATLDEPLPTSFLLQRAVVLAGEAHGAKHAPVREIVGRRFEAAPFLNLQVIAVRPPVWLNPDAVHIHIDAAQESEPSVHLVESPEL